MKIRNVILGIGYWLIFSSSVQADKILSSHLLITKEIFEKNLNRSFASIDPSKITSAVVDPKLKREFIRLNNSKWVFKLKVLDKLANDHIITMNTSVEYYNDILKNYNKSFTQEFPDIAKKAKGIFYGKIALPIVSAAAGAFIYKKYEKQRLEQFLIQKKWTVKNRQKAIIAGGIISAIIGGTVGFLSVVITGNFIFNKGEKDRLSTKNVLLHQLKVEARKQKII